MNKTVEIPVRRCTCGADMTLVVFRPHIYKEYGNGRYADYYRLRWECPNCDNRAEVKVIIQ
jgi:hypothetical protein